MIKIELEENKFIEFDEYDKLFFYGNNHEMIQKLVRSLKRFSCNKSLNSLEEIVYGENGLEIYRDNERLNSKNIEFHFLQDSLSIYKEVDLSKGNLMMNYLQNLQEEVEVNTQLEEIKNSFLKLEIFFNQKMKEISDNISSNFLDLTFDSLLKNHLFLSCFDSMHDYPLNMLDSDLLVDEYVQLIEKQLLNNPKETWIVLINPESFISKEKIQSLLKGLERISEKTGLLKILIIAKETLEIQYYCDDIPKTVLLAEECHQMPEFNSFRKSIEKHYPDQLKLSDEELCQEFYEIASNVGVKPNLSGKSGRNMVLLRVIDELLGYDDFSFSVNFEQLSKLEKAYLQSEH